MSKILKYMKGYGLQAVLILVLLVVQAYCDLALPGYTSAIVDTGIQQGGVADAVPETIRGETLATLEILMTEPDAATLEAAYAPADADGVRALASGSDRAVLNELMTQPELICTAMTSASDRMDLETLNGMVAGGQLTREVVAAQTQSMDTSAITDLSDSIKTQMAIQFVKTEYAAQGINLENLQISYLQRTGGQMLLVSVLIMLCAILVGFMASRVGAGVGRNLRRNIYGKVLSFSHAEMDKFSTASLITRATNDVQQIQMVVIVMLRMVLYAPILGIGGVIKVMNTKTGMGWIIGVAVGAVLALVLVLMLVALPKFKIMQTLVDKLNLVSRETLTGIMVIRAFSREEHEKERFDVANTDLMRTQLFTNRVMTFMMPAMMLVMNGVTILIVWFGGKGIDAGSLQVGDMMAYITYTMQIIMSFLMLTMVSIMLPRAGVAAERIDEVLTTEPSIQDPATPKALPQPLKGEVSFRDVSFRYPGADEDALEHITFTAKPGQTTAIIGSTGCGKSTLLNMIPRFFDATEGAVTIDGVDVRDITQQELHGLMGYVPQKGVLFSGDIRSNLKFGGEDISDDTMRKAAEVAQASEFISQKEEGYDSPIAQGGGNVSGGQKQRLSIARAIAKNPKIYLFDDSFSALDYRTDVQLRRALGQHVQDATVLIVAQRISTILHADQIIVLEDGKIAGIGTHSHLLAECDAYREIARSQLSEKELQSTEEGGAQG